MKNCKNCYHYHMCDLQYRLEEHQDCKHYKDESLIIDLSCKVGQTVYILMPSCKPLTNQLCGRTDRCIDFGCVPYIKLEKFSREMTDRVGIDVFLTKEEADKAFKECAKAYIKEYKYKYL